MLTVKRVLIATLCGFAFGVVCMLFASANPEATLPVWSKWTIIFGRGLTGFAIGISALRMSWWLHGIVMGFIGSIPMAFPVMDRPEIALGTFVMGVIYGFLTELITTIFFKSKSAGVTA
jgi:hypothetical protein